MAVFDPEKIKLDFPILNQKFDFGRLVYLDNGATTQKPKQVIDGIKEFYEKHNSNVHRSSHELGEDATSFYEEAREKVAKFINAEPEEIVFTSGTTEGINFVADAWLRRNIKKDDEIVVTHVEHHANFLPWLRIAQEKEAKLKFIELDTKTYELKTSNLNELINEKTKLVAVVHASNVLGDVWDEQNNQLEKVVQFAHKVGAKILIDSAQTSPRRKIDVKKLNTDFLVFSGHKMLGPTGIGILYIKKDMHDLVEPYRVGGSMIRYVSLDKAEWREAPNKFEAGTPPIAQAIALGYAIDYLQQKVDFKALKKHETKLCCALIDGLQKIKEIKIWGDVERLKKSGHLVCFSVDGIHAHDVSAYLSKYGVTVRSGNHCAQPLMNLLGVQATVRVSFYLYNTLKDVDDFLKKLHKAIEYFGIGNSILSFSKKSCLFEES
jgi:cysteine desulfurase/selenocysteine lyase